MDKNAIKKFATWARVELISRVSQKAEQLGVTQKDPGNPMAQSAHGNLLSAAEITQRAALIARVRTNGWQQTMEEVAYTWFNRFCALRYMEVNGYLPSHIRVFTDEEGAFNPQILTEAIHVELKGLDREKVYQNKEKNQTEALYKYLLITQCNALSELLPRVFQRIEDYTELLLPDNLLRHGSVVEQMVALIPEEDWLDQVQIIGWLYQYYNSEPKDRVFANLKKNIKISKHDIPAATQLFTPDWIVRYMVENSLGRLWLERERANDPSTDEKAAAEAFGWKYYLEEAEQEPEVQAQLTSIRASKKGLKPEDIRCIDPCMGSGHILVYMFDVLMQIYLAYGYSAWDAVRSILMHNLYGLDIDVRAAQLAYFAVMMKARQYEKRLLTRTYDDGRPDIPQPHVYPIMESNDLSTEMMDYFVAGNEERREAMDTLIQELKDAKEYGSILSISPIDFDDLYARFDEVFDDVSIYREAVLNILLPFVRQAQTLAQKYDVVVTNPPYMGSSNMNGSLSAYVKEEYPDSKSDLFAVFIERCGNMTVKGGYTAMITQHAWMFLSSYEKLRKKMNQRNIISMAHLGARAFDEIGGEVVQTTAFVISKSYTVGYLGSYARLIEPTTQDGKEEMFLAGENRFVANQESFKKIPGAPVAYWVSPIIRKLFNKKQDLFIARSGITTGDNDFFLKFWWEVKNINIYLKHDKNTNRTTWYFHNKGGDFRKWYGNIELVIRYDEQSIKLMEKRPGFRHDGRDFFFMESGTWGKTTNGLISLRYSNDQNTFNTGGCCLFTETTEKLLYAIALLNSNVMREILAFLCPTLSYTVGDILKIPVVYRNTTETYELIASNINLSKEDWDSFETSWDFKRHPMV